MSDPIPKTYNLTDSRLQFLAPEGLKVREFRKLRKINQSLPISKRGICFQLFNFTAQPLDILNFEVIPTPIQNPCTKQFDEEVGEV